jgi:UDP-N-acetyl-2-amino-2-deoxyglucuronate dehydrogenase
MERVKTAIVGCGKVGHMHARALKNVPESVFTAVCGREINKTRIFAGQYGVREYSDIEEMVADAGVEAVIICTPHPNHTEPAVKAAKAGLHV